MNNKISSKVAISGNKNIPRIMNIDSTLTQGDRTLPAEGSLFERQRMFVGNTGTTAPNTIHLMNFTLAPGQVAFVQVDTLLKNPGTQVAGMRRRFNMLTNFNGVLRVQATDLGSITNVPYYVDVSVTSNDFVYALKPQGNNDSIYKCVINYTIV